MAGMPKISFPITTKNPAAQEFFTQVSGRFTAFGITKPNAPFVRRLNLIPPARLPIGDDADEFDNATRAKKFMAECQKHKAGVSERETLYI